MSKKQITAIIITAIIAVAVITVTAIIMKPIKDYIRVTEEQTEYYQQLFKR